MGERQKREKEWRKKKEGMETKLNADITKLRNQNKESELKMKEREEAQTKNEENRKSNQEFFRKQQEEEDANECIRKAFAGFFTKEVKKALKEKEKGKTKKYRTDNFFPIGMFFLPLIEVGFLVRVQTTGNLIGRV